MSRTATGAVLVSGLLAFLVGPELGFGPITSTSRADERKTPVASIIVIHPAVASQAPPPPPPPATPARPVGGAPVARPRAGRTRRVRRARGVGARPRPPRRVCPADARRRFLGVGVRRRPPPPRPPHRDRRRAAAGRRRRRRQGRRRARASLGPQGRPRARPGGRRGRPRAGPGAAADARAAPRRHRGRRASPRAPLPAGTRRGAVAGGQQPCVPPPPRTG